MCHGGKICDKNGHFALYIILLNSVAFIVNIFAVFKWLAAASLLTEPIILIIRSFCFSAHLHYKRIPQTATIYILFYNGSLRLKFTNVLCVPVIVLHVFCVIFTTTSQTARMDNQVWSSNHGLCKSQEWSLLSESTAAERIVVSELIDFDFLVSGSSIRELEDLLAIQHLHFMNDSAEVHELSVISFLFPALLWNVFEDLLMKMVLSGIWR